MVHGFHWATKFKGKHATPLSKMRLRFNDLYQTVYWVILLKLDLVQIFSLRNYLTWLLTVWCNANEEVTMMYLIWKERETPGGFAWHYICTPPCFCAMQIERKGQMIIHTYAQGNFPCEALQQFWSILIQELN